MTSARFFVDTRPLTEEEAQACQNQSLLYETLLLLEGRPLFWEDHARRMATAAKGLGLSLPKGLDDLPSRLPAMLPDPTPGKLSLRLDLAQKGGEVPELLISIRPFPAAYSEGLFRKGADLVIAPVARENPGGLIPAAKEHGRPDALQAQAYAEEKGALEALQPDAEGRVVEATRSNLFFVEEGVLCTPALKAGILDGITRARVLEIAQRLQIPMREYSPPPKRLLKAQEWFITSSLKGILPIATINQQAPGDPVPGPVTTRIADAYQDYLENPP